MSKTRDEGMEAVAAKGAPEGSEGATAAATRAGGCGRWSSRRKVEAVVRLMRGESLDALSRELCLTAARLSAWRDTFLAAGEAALKSRAPDGRDEQLGRLEAKIGELTMQNELLHEKARRLQVGLPLFARARSWR